MFKIIAILTLIISVPALSKNIPKGMSLISLDYNYTTARELWYGDNTLHNFCDNAGTKGNCEESNPYGQQRFNSYGLNYSYGFAKDFQLDFRVAYTKSKLKYASHADAKQDETVKQISEMALKVGWDAYENNIFLLNIYLAYAHPWNTNPKHPSFIAVNDFSQHLSAGMFNSVKIVERFSFLSDFRVIFRTAQDWFEEEDLPANQFRWDMNFSYQVSSMFNFGGGISWLHTFKGPDIGSQEWKDLIAKGGGIPPFYAARERFFGYNIFASQTIGERNWVGISMFQKFWGRNTDRGQTWSVFVGTYF